MKLFFGALLLPALAAAAILPETIGDYKRGDVSKPALTDPAVWNEYGLQDSETAAYQNGKAKFTATAWRLLDSTGALAVFDWQRDPKAAASPVAALAAQTPDSLLIARGNYVFRFQGYKPSLPELDAVAAGLLNVDSTALPTLPGFLPSDNLVPNSERYIVGPAGLAKFYPGIAPSVAAFHLGVEVQTGVFHSPKGDLDLAIFNYPTHQMAIQRIEEFGKLPGVVAKRSGPFIAVIVAPKDPDAAEHLLSLVRFQATVTASEYIPTRRDNIGNLVINAFILIGILLVFSVVAGLFVGGFRAAFRRGKKPEELEPMILLHLEKR